ncbi:hypothetical protein FRC03_012714 [Tulasnella sp. 419]|nr:hypothetical protein FRC03_012714 [Tulasnella sp. 419]
MPELQPKVKPSNDRLSTRPLSANKDNRMSFAGPPPGRMTGSGGSTPARSRSQEARQKPDRRARTPSPGRDREPGKVLQKQKQKERGRDQPQQQPQGRQPGRSPVGQRRSGSNSPPRRMMPHAQSHGKTPNHHLGGGPSGPESPRTSFWNFYNPPAGGPSSRQPQPSHPHRSSSQGDSPQNTETMYNALWGSNPSGRSDPPGRRRSPQDHHSGTQSPILPGSYPSGHFPFGGPPPPPPQVQQPRPQTHQTGGGGSNSGLGSFIGGLVPPQSQGGSGGGSTASQAAHLVGHVGMSLYEKFAKSSNSRN